MCLPPFSIYETLSTFLSFSYSVSALSNAPRPQAPYALLLEGQHCDAYPFCQLVQLWTYLTHAQLYLIFYFYFYFYFSTYLFCSKLNLSQSMALRIRRVSHVANASRCKCQGNKYNNNKNNYKVCSKTRKPRSHHRSQPGSQSDPNCQPDTPTQPAIHYVDVCSSASHKGDVASRLCATPPRRLSHSGSY